MAEVYMAGDLRNGTTFELDSQVFKVVEFQHVKPGKGAAFVRTKIKNVITGAVLERTFNPSEKLQGAEIEKREMQYLYADGDLYYFMDNETYEQTPLNKEQLGDSLKYIKENMNVKGGGGKRPPPFWVVKRQPHAKRGDKKLKLWTEKVSNDKIEVATNRNKKSKENPWMN